MVTAGVHGAGTGRQDGTTAFRYEMPPTTVSFAPAELVGGVQSALASASLRVNGFDPGHASAMHLFNGCHLLVMSRSRSNDADVICQPRRSRMTRAAASPTVMPRVGRMTL